MSEMIQFPDKKRQLQGNATRKMLAHDYLAAKKDWLMLYELEPNFEVLSPLVETLRLLGDFEGAIAFASEYEWAYLSSEETLVDYAHLYLLDGQYIFVHRLLTKYPNERLESELLQLEMAQDILGETDYDYHARQLTNPFILPKLVEELIACGVKEQMKVYSIFKGEQALDLATCPLFHDAPALSELLRLVDETWSNRDPQIAEAITIEVHAHFALLYPFLPLLEEISDWEKSYRYEYEGIFGDEIAAKQLANYPEIQQLKEQIRAYYHEFA